MNEYFDLIQDEDLDDSPDEEKDTWIWGCEKCGAIFSSKAIPGRTIFPWFGYHPSDGDCQTLDDETRIRIEHHAHKCGCDFKFLKRVTDVQKLRNMVVAHENMEE